MSQNRTALLQRHVDYETGHIVRVDVATGIIKVRKKIVQRNDPRNEYMSWADKRRADPSLLMDSQRVAQAIAARIQIETVGCPSSADQGSTNARASSGATKGRPKSIFENPVASFLHVLVIPHPLSWVDDIIQGATITGAGVSNGKINVKVRAVIGAMFLTTITAEACMTNGVGERAAQRIAKAARHAAHGIASYIERRPALKRWLQVEMAYERQIKGLGFNDG
jgi:hypothetical protein